MTQHYYIDESGSTGDLTKTGRRFDFGQQQIFTLAALGVDDSDALGWEIARLKARHGIQAAELKSLAVRDKPALISDLVVYIKEKQAPLMIEVVDKRFMIAANIINTLIMPAVGAYDFTPEAQVIRKTMADYISILAPSILFEAYITACDAFSTDNVIAAFNALLNWLAQQPRGDQIAAGIQRFAIDRFEDFKALQPDDELNQRRCIPLPDQGKHGQSVWMLPNLTCFTNIYARINRRHARMIKGVTLFHDEHAQFDEIVRAAKRDAEELKKTYSAPIFPFSDYHFEEEATLVFTGSHVAPGIQASDVLAGFVMRYARDILYGGHLPSQQEKEVFFDIVALSEPAEGTGINFVIPTPNMLTLGVMPTQGSFSAYDFDVSWS